MRVVKSAIKKIPFFGEKMQKLYWRNARHRAPEFRNSKEYWEKRYRDGGTSGAGSYGEYANFKAEVLNDFVEQYRISTVIEFGCGDGNQLLLARYPSYVGLDVSQSAIEKCREIFYDDFTKNFKTMDEYNGETAELALSLDVIFHLIEDNMFHEYMIALFGAARRFVIIYSSNLESDDMKNAAHVRHRNFTKWVGTYCPEWNLKGKIPNCFPYNSETNTGTLSDFFIYERR